MSIILEIPLEYYAYHNIWVNRNSCNKNFLYNLVLSNVIHEMTLPMIGENEKWDCNQHLYKLFELILQFKNSKKNQI